MNFHYQKALRGLLLLTVSVWLFACDNQDVETIPIPTPAQPPLPQPTPPDLASFDVTVANLTNAQPLSPIAVIAHEDGYRLFTVGTAATPMLEVMAEGGDNSDLLTAAAADVMVTASVSGAAPIGPAGSETVTVVVFESQLSGLQISVSTMLVNTNDAFTGISAAAVEDMAVGDILTFYGVAYDAGTEADSEMAVDIPGPAGGGEGFNATRDDQADRVVMHSGVVSQDDGLATSSLSEQHRFDNPVVQIRIERTD